MKKIFSRWKTSLVMRYALSYISLLALILSGLFGYLYYYVDNEVREKIIQSQVNRLNRIVYRHEDYISTMLNTAVQMGMSPFIEPFSFEEAPAQAYDLLAQMAPYTVTNGFCDQMYLCFQGDDHIYSSTSSMTLERFARLMDYETITAEALINAIRQPGRLTAIPSQVIDSPLAEVRRTKTVTFLMPLGTSAASSKGTMIFLIKDRVYQDMFSDAIEDDNNTYIFYGGDVLAGAEDYAELSAQAISQQLGGQEELKVTSFEHGGETWELIAIGRRDWEMQYVTVLRSRALTSSVWQSLDGMTMLLAGLGALGVLSALLLARRNAKPIQELTTLLPGRSTEQDDLALIQTGIRELSARNTDLTTRLELSLPMQRHDFVLRFMKGRYATRDEAAAHAAALGLMIDRPFYAVILSSVQEHNDQPLDLRRAPFEALSGLVGYGVELMALNVHMYLVFADDAQTIRTAAQMIQDAGEERSGHAIVALSGIQTDFLSAPNAYLEAATAYDNRFVMDENGLLDYSTISTSIEDIMPQARKITDGINQAILLRNRDMLSGQIGELLHFLKHTSMSPFVFRLIYNDVIDALMREHMVALAAEKNVQEIYDIFSLSSYQNINDLDALLRQLCDTILCAEDVPQEAEPAQAEDSAIHQVVGYINSHFADPELSISAIAEAFDMPTARLSLAFKEVTRMSPLEYLTLLRVERSKDLLAQTDMAIKEIATQVGYYDASSFIRRFKQMTGFTPLQYRRGKEKGEDVHAEG